MKSTYTPDTLTQASLTEMATFEGRPCLSLYQVLALSLHKVQLYEGDRNALDAVALAAGVPQTMTAALGEEHTESHTTVSSYGGIGGHHMAMHHGHVARKTGSRATPSASSARWTVPCWNTTRARQACP